MQPDVGILSDVILKHNEKLQPIAVRSALTNEPALKLAVENLAVCDRGVEEPPRPCSMWVDVERRLYEVTELLDAVSLL